MRISALALLTLLVGSAVGFVVPPQIGALSRTRALHVAEENNQHRHHANGAGIPKGGSTATKAPASSFTAECVDEGKVVAIQFPDGSCHHFHALWLRDACRDEHHVVPKAGERLLTATPVSGDNTVHDLRAVDVTVNDDARLVVQWNQEASPTVRESTFDYDFLQRYAPVVASCVQQGGDTSNIRKEDWALDEDIPSWLAPYTGYPNAKAPKSVEYWNNENQEEAPFERFDHANIMTKPASLLRMLQTLLDDTGVALIDNVPPEGDSNDVARELQKLLSVMPSIVHQPDAASISYNPVKRLNQHTDSSIPPHGIPGLVLSMHYVQGYGANTLTDGFAVANKLREEDPEAFALLTQYGYDGERDFAASRVDSTQTHAEGLVIRRKHPIVVTDSDGTLSRIQYNEVFRMPLTLPFEIFPKWYAAFSRFVQLCHSVEYHRTVPMKENTILLINNWRVLHGRAANCASPDRHLVGGTIVREAVYSRAMQLARMLREDD